MFTTKSVTFRRRKVSSWLYNSVSKAIYDPEKSRRRKNPTDQSDSKARSSMMGAGSRNSAFEPTVPVECQGTEDIKRKLERKTVWERICGRTKRIFTKPQKNQQQFPFTTLLSSGTFTFDSADSYGFKPEESYAVNRSILLRKLKEAKSKEEKPSRAPTETRSDRAAVSVIDQIPKPLQRRQQKKNVWMKKLLWPWTPKKSTVQKKKGAIGVNLDQCPRRENCLVPKILELLVETIERQGLETEGIYRIPGNNAAIVALAENLKRGDEPNPERDQRWNDVKVVASLLKLFLRNLPSPILTFERYPDFINAASESDNATSVGEIKLLIQDLPEVNYETCRLLVFHLRKIAENSEKNLMEAKNLGIVFGPTVVRSTSEDPMVHLKDLPKQSRVMELLITNAEEIFRRDKMESQDEDFDRR